MRYPQGIFTMQDEGESYDHYWTERGRALTETLSDWQKERADLILKEIGRNGGVESLGDIGAGNGAVLRYVALKLKLKKTIAYEISPSSLVSLRSLGFTAVECDVRAIQDRKKIEKVSYNLLLEVLEHLHDPEGVLKVAYDQSERGVFFSIPNTGFLTHRFRLLLGKVPLQWKRNPSEHVRFWTIVDVRWWLRTLGYGRYSIHPYKGVPLLNKLWPNLFAEGVVVYISKDHV